MSRGDLTRTPRYEQVLKSSEDIARAMDKSFVGVEHLFLAIIRDRGAVPTQVPASLADLDQIDLAVLEVLDSPSYNSSS